MARGRGNHAILALLLLGATLVYVNSLSNPFVIDDRIIISNTSRSGQSWSLRDFFKRSLFGTVPSEDAYFRPLTLLTFALNRWLGGEHPQGFRVVNIAFHLLVTALIFLLLSRLAGRWVAVFSALIYALHPAHVQAVSYISSRSDPLYAALALLCLLFWHKGNGPHGNRRPLYLGLALSAFFLGLFAKETMIVVFPLAVVMHLSWNPAGPWRSKIRENLLWYVGFMLLFSVYILIRLGAGFPLLMEGEVELGFGSRLLLAPKIFLLYIAIIFYPVDLHLFRTVVVPQTFFEWQVILGTTLLGGLAILAYFFWSSRKEISFGILWFLISMLPLLNLTLLNAPIMEHWLYLPMIGPVLAFVGAVRSLAEQVGETRGAALGLSFLALLLSVKTVTRNAEWGDLVKVFSQNVSAYPRDFLAWFWLAKALREQGKLDDAIRAFKAGSSINPNFTRAWVDLGESLSLAGRDNEAESAFRRAISLKQGDPMIHHMLGVHQLKAGKNLAAMEALQTSLNLRPSATVYHALGSVYLRLGDSKAAEQAFHKALALYPHNLRFHAEIHIHLGKLYLGRGKRQEALEEWRLGLRFDPNHAEARSLLKNTQRNEN